MVICRWLPVQLLMHCDPTHKKKTILGHTDGWITECSGLSGCCCFEGLHLIQQSQSKKDHDKLEHIGKWPPSSPSTEDMRESEKKPTYFSRSQEGFDGISESVFDWHLGPNNLKCSLKHEILSSTCEWIYFLKKCPDVYVFKHLQTTGTERLQVIFQMEGLSYCRPRSMAYAIHPRMKLKPHEARFQDN